LAYSGFVRLSFLQFSPSWYLAHRDIKPQCALDCVHLGDFGLVTYKHYSSCFECGTRAYMGPECLGGLFSPVQVYDNFAKILWSLGIVLMNLLGSGRPWEEETISDPHFHVFVMLQNANFLDPVTEKFEYSFTLNILCLETWQMTSSRVLLQVFYLKFMRLLSLCWKKFTF
ncbi:hypothetical protein VP01_5211g1, partial [Puccinia sorghi]